jgi:hypothetical protein
MLPFSQRVRLPMRLPRTRPPTLSLRRPTLVRACRGREGRRRANACAVLPHVSQRGGESDAMSVERMHCWCRRCHMDRERLAHPTSRYPSPPSPAHTIHHHLLHHQQAFLHKPHRHLSATYQKPCTRHEQHRNLQTSATDHHTVIYHFPTQTTAHVTSNTVVYKLLPQTTASSPLT